MERARGVAPIRFSGYDHFPGQLSATLWKVADSKPDDILLNLVKNRVLLEQVAKIELGEFPIPTVGKVELESICRHLTAPLVLSSPREVERTPMSTALYLLVVRRILSTCASLAINLRTSVDVEIDFANLVYRHDDDKKTYSRLFLTTIEAGTFSLPWKTWETGATTMFFLTGEEIIRRIETWSEFK